MTYLESKISEGVPSNYTGTFASVCKQIHEKVYEAIEHNIEVHEKHHVALFFDKYNVYGNIGYNSLRSCSMGTISRHAEVDALFKLKGHITCRGKRVKAKSYDLLVLRMTARRGMLASSRPCFHCIKTLSESDINIRYVYYSDVDRTIRREKFNDMVLKLKTEPESVHMSRGARKRLGIT